ncbi:hypothetical protein [Pseudarthrobacter sp. NBSH8]|uniref:hypothetical protein n=1 Tax=Pseudarthrobacter sp. NBSH8 TaxID=2596911 RepID=UPI0016247E5E|nr:hypothetical protein [Pseudarthrobacter sp. NBSH8]
MAAIKMAAVSSSTLLLMNRWTAFIGLPETWIACAHRDPQAADMKDFLPGVQKVLAGLPAWSRNGTQPL